MDQKYYRLFQRQGKAEKIEEALKQSGYYPTNLLKLADFILADHDQRGEMRTFKAYNKKFFIYPHSARSMILWDGIIPPTTITRCNFVFSEGAKEVMKAYGYPRPVEVMGWTYCPIQEFSPSSRLDRILFAPIHPNASPDKKGRRLMEFDQDLNRRTFDILRRQKAEITVRFVGSLADNGLAEVPGVRYEVSDLELNSSLLSIQSGYDLVVGHQTFAYLAVACGIPTVMFGEDTPPHAMHVTVKSWERYKNVLMYPLDLLKGIAEKVIETALSTAEPIAEWKRNVIGKPFDASTFLNILSQYM